MILSFTVSNYRSFKDEVTFSMMPSSRVKDVHNEHLTSEGVLRVGVIYGANGAGKSNLFKALARLKDLASSVTYLPRDPFRFSRQEDIPTLFDLIFSTGGRRFRYGVAEGNSGILEEWFSCYDENDSEHVIYERKITEDGTPKIVTNFSEDTGNDRLRALATVGVTHSRTFLASAFANLQEGYYGDLAPVLMWLEKLQLVSPSATVGSLARMLSNGGFREFASGILRFASTGVNRLKIEKKELSEETLERMYPQKFGKVRERLKRGSLPSIHLQEGLELCYERQGGKDSFYTLSIGSEHEISDGEAICMDISEESDGTRRLLNLLPALFHMSSGASVFFIDEIDRSMHPLLSRTFLEFFLEKCNGSQLILTTHEANLLDLALLRRDEIWFTEKDSIGATHIYPLTEFRDRGEDNLRRHYLQGRFGAVPFLGDLASFRQAMSEEE